MLVKFDDKNKKVRVLLRAHEILTKLNKNQRPNNFDSLLSTSATGIKSIWHPEYGSFMLESTPGKPYGYAISELSLIESNMRYRRLEIMQLLEHDEAIMTLTNFPRLGTPKFTYPSVIINTKLSSLKINNNNKIPITNSKQFPDEAIYVNNPRFKSLTDNLNARRGSNVDINVGGINIIIIIYLF